MASILDPAYTFTTLADEIGLDYRLRKAVARLGHIRPTLVQSKCLPLAISSGRDLMVRAKTGSGKTLAYCLPLLQKILSNKRGEKDNPGVRGIVLVPTRELCTQVYNQLQQLTYYCDDLISLAILSIGRVRTDTSALEELDRQEAMLRDNPNVIVATPNGLLTNIRSNALNLRDTVETLVVDEADLVLSFGNSDDINEIVKSLPRIYQGMLMSATLSPELESLKKIVLNSPVTLKLEDQEENQSSSSLKQFYVKLPKTDKNLVLYVFLKLGLLRGKGLLFVNSTDAGYRLKLFLEQFHIRSAVLNDELPFCSRLNIIEQFNVGNFDYLIATDSSADTEKATLSEDKAGTTKRASNLNKSKEYGISRGLDFYRVSFVVNFEMPPNAGSYAHRIGRTARGGVKGVALTFVNSKSMVETEILESIQDSQPRISLSGASTDNLHANLADFNLETGIHEQRQPLPLDFDLQEIEGFRYRVEDVQRAVTKTAVRETRAAELKAEILNSEKLQSHFEANPADLQLLAHDRVATHVSRVQAHLKNVPKYLLPRGMQVANVNKKRKRRKADRERSSSKKKSIDPLRNFDGNANIDDISANDNDPLADFMDDDDVDDNHDNRKSEDGKRKQSLDGPEKRIFANTKDGTGFSTAGRNVWKERHRKGQFSSKPRKSDRKYKAPLGL